MLMQILKWLFLNLTLKLSKLFAKMIKNMICLSLFPCMTIFDIGLHVFVPRINFIQEMLLIIPKCLNKRRRSSIQSLKTLLHRVSLTTDLWIPQHQAIGCACHYIDHEWTLNRKIIAFS